MNLITRTGSFRGCPLDWGVDIKEHEIDGKEVLVPFFNVDVLLTEYWDDETDPDEPQWVDYTSEDEHVTGYLCLISKAGNVMKNHEQIMKVFDWDGENWVALAEGDYTDVMVQIRVADNDPNFADKNPYQVQWLDEYDATPMGGGLKKASKEDLDKLGKKFGALLKKNSGPAKPKSAPSNPKGRGKGKGKAASAVATTKRSPAQKMKDNRERSEQDAANLEKREANKAALAQEQADAAAGKQGRAGKGKDKQTRRKPMPTFGKKKEEETTEVVTLELTRDEAWERMQAAREEIGDDCTDDMVTEALIESCQTVADTDEPDVDGFTKAQWGEVTELAIQTLVGV